MKELNNYYDLVIICKTYNKLYFSNLDKANPIYLTPISLNKFNLINKIFQIKLEILELNILHLENIFEKYISIWIYLEILELNILD